MLTSLTPPDTANGVTHRAAAPRALAWAMAIALACYLVTGLSEALLIRLLRPTEFELGWTSDAMLSVALGVAVYLWLHLRATRQALTTHERAQLVMQTQLSLAEAMQRRLLPAVPTPEGGFDWAATLVPADRIGGDFYDFVQPAPNVWLMLVADVSGKGIPAAMALTLLRATFRAVARETTSPSALASRMSAAFHEEWHGSPYVTAIIARVDAAERRLTYTNAGHPRGLLFRHRHERALAAGGPPLGLLKDARFDEESLSLTASDVCVFVTDGISEALDDLRTPWTTAIVDSVWSSPWHGAEALCSAILALARNGQGPEGVEHWNDDRTVVVLGVGLPGQR